MLRILAAEKTQPLQQDEAHPDGRLELRKYRVADARKDNLGIAYATIELLRSSRLNSDQPNSNGS
jgi:hypothetical protein